MMQHAFTEDSFKVGIGSYLQLSRSLDINFTANEQELYADLEITVYGHKTLSKQYKVSEIFNSWTRQSGYPVVFAARDEGPTDIELVQFIDFRQKVYINHSLWWIPISMTYQSNPVFNVTTPFVWMHTEYAFLNVSHTVPANDWYLLNVLQTGYYRVQYDEENYQRLAQQLKTNHQVIHPMSRRQLISDAFELTMGCQVWHNEALDLVEYLLRDREPEGLEINKASKGIKERETSDMVWLAAIEGLLRIQYLYDDLASKMFYVRSQERDSRVPKFKPVSIDVLQEAALLMVHQRPTAQGHSAKTHTRPTH